MMEEIKEVCNRLKVPTSNRKRISELHRHAAGKFESVSIISLVTIELQLIDKNKGRGLDSYLESLDDMTLHLTVADFMNNHDTRYSLFGFDASLLGMTPKDVENFHAKCWKMPNCTGNTSIAINIFYELQKVLEFDEEIRFGYGKHLVGMPDLEDTFSFFEYHLPCKQAFEVHSMNSDFNKYEQFETNMRCVECGRKAKPLPSSSYRSADEGESLLFMCMASSRGEATHKRDRVRYINSSEIFTEAESKARAVHRNPEKFSSVVAGL